MEGAVGTRTQDTAGCVVSGRARRRPGLCFSCHSRCAVYAPGPGRSGGFSVKRSVRDANAVLLPCCLAVAARA